MNSFGFGDFANVSQGGYKLPLCLVLDNSGSMSERDGNIIKINELNNTVETFLNFAKNEPKVMRQCEISIISFGGESPRIISGFTSPDKVKFETLRPFGRTPMGEAVKLSLDLVNKRREFYKSKSIEHYKPIILLMTDGEPTDKYEYAARELSDLVKNNKIIVFPIGIGNSFNKDILKQFSPMLDPQTVNGIDGFQKLLLLLKKSSSGVDPMKSWNESF